MLEHPMDYPFEPLVTVNGENRTKRRWVPSLEISNPVFEAARRKSYFNGGVFVIG